MLKSIFWDYSASVQHINSQLSTVTAATTCAAITCLLENRSFDAKEVFLQEIQTMLQSGALESTCRKPSKANAVCFALSRSARPRPLYTKTL